MKIRQIMEAAKGAGKSFFDGLQELDVIEPVVEYINKGIYEITEEGKLKPRRYHKPADWTWIKVDKPSERKCHIWMDIYFNHYRIVPRGCRHCWKVVVTMDNLTQLFQMAEIQEGMDLHAKCGMERRSYGATPNSYLAFWYAPMSGGLRGGRQLYKIVKEHLEKEWPNGGWTIMLKRGCTEMQQQVASDQWDNYADVWDKTEALLDSAWDLPQKASYKLFPIQKIHTMNLWIVWSAERNNDYLAFTDGRPFNVVQTPYQDSIHSEKDFPGLVQEPKLEVVS